MEWIRAGRMETGAAHSLVWPPAAPPCPSGPAEGGAGTLTRAIAHAFTRAWFMRLHPRNKINFA